MTGKKGRGERWGRGGRISDDVETSEGEGGEGRERTGQLRTGYAGDGASGDTGRYGTRWITACTQHSEWKAKLGHHDE